MIAVALTGGIGSGKSTVGRLLEARGAVRIDADELARAAVEPGTGTWSEVVERFGEAIVDPAGSIDRAALARIVFDDAGAREDLNAIVHPEVRRRITAGLAGHGGTEDIVILEIPLLIEGGDRDRYPLAGVLVVDSPADLAVERLVRSRGMGEADVRRRIAAQAPRETRLREADYVILNIGTLEELRLMTELAWGWMEKMREESLR